jgi:hypothetical protein
MSKEFIENFSKNIRNSLVNGKVNEEMKGEENIRILLSNTIKNYKERKEVEKGIR